MSIANCENKLNAAIGLLQEQVKAFVGKVEGQVELDAALALAAAREIASVQGCVWPTEQEMLSKRPRFPGSYQPMPSTAFDPSTTVDPYRPFRPAGSTLVGPDGETYTLSTDSTLAGDPVLRSPTPPASCSGGDPEARTYFGNTSSATCQTDSDTGFSWYTDWYADPVWADEMCCYSQCTSNLDGGDGRPIRWCFSKTSPGFYYKYLDGDCNAACKPPKPQPAPIPGPNPQPQPTPQPQPQPTPLPHCDYVCNEETGELIECCTDEQGGVDCTISEPGVCAPEPPPPPSGGCCTPSPITVNPVLKVEPPDCTDPDNASLSQCFRAPKPPAREPPKAAKPQLWGNKDDCDKVSIALAEIASRWKNLSRTIFGAGVLDGTMSPEQLADVLTGRVPVALGWIMSLAVPPLAALVNYGARAVGDGQGCGNPSLLLPMFVKWFYEIVGKWTGIDTSDAARNVAYAINATCPSMLPSVSELHAAYLRDEITFKEWQCWVRANNQLERPATQMMLASRAKPNIADSISLLRRKFSSYDEFLKNMRGNGVLTDRDLQSFYELSKVIPPYSDLVRMMVRDSFDDTVAARFGYDDQFAQKFTPKAKEWADAQGISEELMKFLWRAHWRLPSPTQAFQMLHRNRPGRVADDLVVTEQDVISLLQIDDLAPFWQNRLTSISYSVMRLVDIRKQFNYGVYGRRELINQLQDRGYSEGNATIQADAMTQDRFDWLMGRPDCKGYIAGTVTRAEVTASLQRYRPDAVTLGNLLARLEFLKNVGQRKKCVAALKKRFIGGEIDAATAIAGLTSLFFEPLEATEWVATWTCELKTRSKEATAQQLCDWLGKGLITRTEMRQRLMRIGYSLGDSHRILLSCLVGMHERRQRMMKQIKDLKDKAKEQIDKAKNRMFKEGQKKEDKERRVWQGIGDDSEAAKLLLVKAARKWSRKWKLPSKETLAELENYFCELRAKKGYSMLGAARLIVEIVGGAIDEGETELRTRYLAIRSTLEDSPQTDMDCAHFDDAKDIPPLPPKPATNGYH